MASPAAAAATGAVRDADMTFFDADMEIAGPGVLPFGLAPAGLRLQVGGWLPAVVMIGSAFVYWVLLLKFVFPATKPVGEAAVAARKAWRSRHNYQLFLYSAIAFGGSLAFTWGRGQMPWSAATGFAEAEGGWWHGLLCSPVEGTWLRVLSWTFTLSKIWEWLDTAFLIWLGSRPPMFLHVYHHATTFWLFCLVMNVPGTEKTGMLLNGFVHTLMYRHYYKPIHAKVVPLITIAQILQLITVTYIWYAVPGECTGTYRFADMREKHLAEWLVPYAMAPVYLLFFVVFFVRRWIVPLFGGSGTHDNKKRQQAAADKKKA